MTKNEGDSILKSSSVVGGMTFVSRITGFVRDIIFANIFGASSSTDAFFVAFKIPNFFRRLFAEGAFTQAFVPVLTEFKERKSGELKTFVSYVFGNLSLILFLITFLGVVFSDQIISLFAPGFSVEDGRFKLASDMLKLTFPYLFFISLTAFCAGIFNTYDKFFLPAITPVILNISLISSALFLTVLFDEPIKALAFGVLVAGILQYLVQLPSLNKLEFLVLPKIGFQFEGVRKVLKLMAPAIIGSAVVQINLLIDSVVASLLAAGGISWLYYSDRLVEFPLGVFGIAIATVILPNLSKKFSNEDLGGFKKTIQYAISLAIVFSLPAMFGLIILSQNIIASLFQYGSFDSFDTSMSSLSLIAYSIGLPAFIIMKVLLTGFFSRQDTKTPVKYGIYAIIFNVAMNLTVVIYYTYNPFVGAHAFLALATSLSAWIQVILLYSHLQKIEIIPKNLFLNSLNLKVLLSCFFMAILLLTILMPIDIWTTKEYYIRGLLLLFYIAIGGIAYIASIYALGFRYKKDLSI